MDNCIFFSKDPKAIDGVIEQLQQQFELTVEEVKADAIVDVFSYLGVLVSINKNGTVTFKQEGLIKRYSSTAECKIVTRNGLRPGQHHLVQM